MKDLHASASTAVRATPDECTATLAAVDRYPAWHPEVVREVHVVERQADGTPARAHAIVRAALGRVTHDFRLLLAIAVEPGRTVTLSRVPHEPSDEERFELVWRVGPGPPTQVAVELSARLEVPRLAPVGRVGAAIARGFADAAGRELGGAEPPRAA